MNRAPRIDTTRNRLAATARLLGLVLDELDDLHLLAYERTATTSDVPVSGGSHDYALDNHGDPRARAAYRALAETTITACADIADAAHTAIRLMREGDLDTPRTRRRIDAEELAEALEARARRIARGDYTPQPAMPQPEASGVEYTVARLRRERDEAQARAERLERRLAQYEPAIPARNRRRRRRAG